MAGKKSWPFPCVGEEPRYPQRWLPATTEGRPVWLNDHELALLYLERTVYIELDCIQMEENGLDCASPFNFPRSRLPSLALTGWFLDMSLGADLIVRWYRKAHSVVNGTTDGSIFRAGDSGMLKKSNYKWICPWAGQQDVSSMVCASSSCPDSLCNGPKTMSWCKLSHPFKLLSVRWHHQSTDIKLHHPILNQGSYRGLFQSHGRCSCWSQVLVSAILFYQ